MSRDKFDFGKNWTTFVERYLNEERLEKAKESFEAFCGTSPLKGKTFVDVGCGSGLFSLAAFRLGACRIVSFDINPLAVTCCERLREREGNPGSWEILQGSALDESFMKSLGTFDFVYSWGVLHHTGAMWDAIGHTAGLVREGGRFYLAVYNRVDTFAVHPDGRVGSSRFWLAEKKFYVGLPEPMQLLFDGFVMAAMVLVYLLTFQNPVRRIREHTNLRGMSWAVDIKDWLGGYPYEVATVEEMFRFMKPRGFHLENIKSNNGLLNNEYLFLKTNERVES